jgi:hypothetical protein
VTVVYRSLNPRSARTWIDPRAADMQRRTEAEARAGVQGPARDSSGRFTPQPSPEPPTLEPHAPEVPSRIVSAHPGDPAWSVEVWAPGGGGGIMHIR